jgi:hypothetical protein
MTNGYCWVVGEFAIIDRRGKVTQQQTVSGYSRIEPINSENQREYLYENAVNHARSKYLYGLHKDSSTDTDFAIVDSGFKIVIETKTGFRKPKDSTRTISKKAKRRAEERVLLKADEKREDKSKMTTKKQEEKMYVKKNQLTLSEKKELMDYKLYLQMKNDKEYQKFKKRKG